MEDDWQGDHNSIHSEGGREKNNQKLKKRYYVSSKAFGGNQHFYVNLRGGTKFHQIYDKIFHPSPQEMIRP